MTRLHLQPLLSSELARRRFLLRPPEPSPDELMGPPGSGLYLGRTQMLGVPVYWDYTRLTNPHLAVVGMTGSGKSYFVKTFISRAYRQWGTQALILDWAGEYGPWVQAAHGKVIRLGKEHSLNLLDCRVQKLENEKGGAQPAAKNAPPIRSFSSATPRSRIEQVLAALAILTDLSVHPRQARLTKAALEDAYKHKRLALDQPVSARTPPSRLPTLRDALDILKKQMNSSKKSARLAPDEALESSIFRLEGFCAPGADYFSKTGGLQLDELIGGGLVSVDLSGLPSESHRSLAGLTILQFLKERMRDEGWSPKKGLKLLVVADEAWKIAQDERSDLVAMVREGRKYAFGLVVASQNPTDLSKTILSNAGTLAAFRLALEEHREGLRASLQCPKSVSAQLERFAVGQSLIRMAFEKPSDFDGPFIISRIEGEEPAVRWKLEVEKMEIDLDREDFKKRLWRLGCTDAQITQVSHSFERNDRALQVEELARLLTGFGLSRSTILSFLRGLGVADAELIKLFARLQARSMGARVQDIVQLAIVDSKNK